MRFCGTIQARRDAKGRVFFPAAFRKQACAESDARFVMRRDIHEACLVIYPSDVWEGEVAALRSRLNSWNRSQAMLLRQFMADIEAFGLDAQGRFILPQRFAAECGIGADVTFIGMDDRIELWPSQRLEKPFVEADAFSQRIEALMAGGD
ncbi:MAG: cell division/cell wall cluster transcriptional repressor MraZ [Prevotellaceae bacterium]|nr:cell division/cell wall cluster transcriptional repressor MraZ [Prevotellaceae bacterium]